MGTTAGGGDVLADSLTTTPWVEIDAVPGVSYFVSVTAIDAVGNAAAQTKGMDPASLAAVPPAAEPSSIPWIAVTAIAAGIVAAIVIRSRRREEHP